jgi:Ca-activated chloride channel family protein
MRPMSRIRRIVAYFFFLVPPLLAQDTPFTMKVDVQVVSVDVVVTDANGELVNDLKPGDFQIYEDGVPQEVRFFSPVAAPCNVFLLFDGSGSMKTQWRFMQDAVYRFISKLRPQDHIAIASFAKGYTIHVPWTLDREDAILALNKVIERRDRTETRLYSALERTLRREFDEIDGRRAIIVLTDGRDTDYSHESSQDLKKALRAAQEERIAVYFVALDGADLSSAPPRLRSYMLEVRSYMTMIADSSGGSVLFPNALKDLTPMYAQIGKTLVTSYSLGYIPTAPAQKGELRHIEVKALPSGVHLKQSRSGYTAP